MHIYIPLEGKYTYQQSQLFASTEDKFDNIKIVEDGTIASVTMDYSFGQIIK